MHKSKITIIKKPVRVHAATAKKNGPLCGQALTHTDVARVIKVYFVSMFFLIPSIFDIVA